MKKIVVGVASSVFSSVTAEACPECRAAVKAGIYNQDFVGNLWVMLLPVLILLMIGIGLYFGDRIVEKIRGRTNKWPMTRDVAR